MEALLQLLPFKKKRRKEDANIPRIDPFLFSSLFDTLVSTQDRNVILKGLGDYRPTTPRMMEDKLILYKSIYKMRKFAYKTEDLELEIKIKQVEEYAGVDECMRSEKDARLYSIICNTKNLEFLIAHQTRVNSLYYSMLVKMAKSGDMELLMTDVLGHSLWWHLYSVALDYEHDLLTTRILDYHPVQRRLKV